MAKKQNESEILFAQEKIPVNGKDIIVHPYSWAGAILVAKPLAVIMKAVVENVDALNLVLKTLRKKEIAENTEEPKEEEGISGQLMAIADFIDGVQNPADIIQALSELVSASTALSTDEVEALMLDDMYKISKAVYEVNKAFFDKRLVPMMKSPSKKQEK